MYKKKGKAKRRNNKKKDFNNTLNNTFYVEDKEIDNSLILGNNFKENNNKNELNITNHSNSIDKEASVEESSYNEKFMLTARNKWRNNKKENPITFEYEILEIKDDLRIYKYSNVERKSVGNNLIYQYYFDKFDENDYKNAYIVLFIGKTGDGKTTAINAFFNILKGIKIEDRYRFILIKEPKKEKGQAESQTDGLHLYYLKDSYNKPIIIIDSQGFGDTRGKEFDELIKGAFEYVFKNVIDHINTVCFIAKSNEARLTMLIKYIFSCVTSLFSEDIIPNFIFLATHADKFAIKKVPKIIECIKSDGNFNEIIKKMDEKWWYAVESMSIFDNDIDKLTKFSFKELNDLYEEKIKNSKPKNLCKSLEIISSRNKIKNLIDNFILNYKNINIEKGKVPEIDRKIYEYENKINDVNYRINNKRREIDYFYIQDPENEISILKIEKDKKVKDLDNQYEEKKVKNYKEVGGSHTNCFECKRSCHDPCDCFGSSFGRCYIFSFLGNCEICGHDKSKHILNSKYKYVDEIEKNKIYNYSKIYDEEEKFRRKRDELYNVYYRKLDEKRNKERELNNLNNEKSQLNNQKNYYINNKENINRNINNLNNAIKLNLLDLIKISEKFDNFAMNKNYNEIDNRYIESLFYILNEIGGDNGAQIKQLKEYKKYNDIFLEIKDFSSQIDLIILNPDSIIDKLKSRKLI